MMKWLPQILIGGSGPVIGLVSIVRNVKSFTRNMNYSQFWDSMEKQSSTAPIVSSEMSNGVTCAANLLN
jgi:hypothetical protein